MKSSSNYFLDCDQKEGLDFCTFRKCILILNPYLCDECFN